MDEKQVATPLGAVELVSDDAGRLRQAADPCGRTVRWGYDAAGHVAWQEIVDGEFPVLQSLYRYDAQGRLESVQHVQGVEVLAHCDAMRYDDAGRRVAWRATVPADAVLSGETHYAYDAQGNPVAIHRIIRGHVNLSINTGPMLV